MATPTAVGTSVKLKRTAYARGSNHNGEPDLEHSPEGNMNAVVMAPRYSSPTTEPAKAIHLICWRSSPLDRRKRKTKLSAERTMHRGNSRRKASIPVKSQGCTS